MVAPERPRAPLTNAQHANLLYTILKQLDLRGVDWALVASTLDIANGHAARMRYTRFKQQMEGTQTQKKGPKTEAAARRGKNKTTQRGKDVEFEEDGEMGEESMKKEIKIEGKVKEEGVVVKSEDGVPALATKLATTTSGPTVSSPSNIDNDLYTAQSPPTKRIKVEHPEENDVVILDELPPSLTAPRRTGTVAPHLPIRPCLPQVTSSSSNTLGDKVKARGGSSTMERNGGTGNIEHTHSKNQDKETSTVDQTSFKASHSPMTEPKMEIEDSGNNVFVDLDLEDMYGDGGDGDVDADVDGDEDGDWDGDGEDDEDEDGDEDTIVVESSRKSVA